MNFEVTGKVRVAVEGARAQLTLPRLCVVRVCSLMLGKVCVAGERLVAYLANVETNAWR